jgi:hypothetical protein
MQLEMAVPGLGLLRSAFGTLAVPGLRNSILMRLADVGGLPAMKAACLCCARIVDAEPLLVDTVLLDVDSGREGPEALRCGAGGSSSGRVRVRYADMAPRHLDSSDLGELLPLEALLETAQDAKRRGATHLPMCLLCALPPNVYDREAVRLRALDDHDVPVDPRGSRYGDLFPARRGGALGAPAEVLDQRVWSCACGDERVWRRTAVCLLDRRVQFTGDRVQRNAAEDAA